jgi:hypothetical protein
MLSQSLALGFTLTVYMLLLILFYTSEKDLLIESYKTYRSHFESLIIDPKHSDLEVQAILGFLAFLTLGYLGGLKKMVFAAFFYLVPLKMLMGQYESYF